MRYPISRMIFFISVFMVVACSKQKDKSAAAESEAASDDKTSTRPPRSAPPESSPPGDTPFQHGAVRRIGSVTGILLEVPDFDGLPLKEKKRIYAMVDAIEHLEAVNFAMAGADVLRTRRVLLGILKARRSVPDSIREKIEPYSERFFLNVGPLDVFTGERFRPGFIPGELAAAAKAAIDDGIDLGVDDFDGADLGANRLEQLEAMLTSLHPVIFGEDRPRDAKVATDTSSNDAKEKERAKVDEAVFNASLKQLAEPIEKMTSSLDEPASAPFIALIAYAKSPSASAFADYVGAYLNAPAAEVAFLMGPIGPARLVEAGKASLNRFEGIVAIRDRDQSGLLGKLALEIPYFERLIPGNAMFRRAKKEIKLPAAAAYHLVSAAPFGAISLPIFRLPAPTVFLNAPSKVMLFTNVLDGEDRLLGDVMEDMLSAEGPSRARLSKWRRAAATAFWSMKSVVGFELGTRNKSDDKAMRFQSDISAILAEMHADLATLHFIFDPKAQRLGLVPEPECAQAVLDAYLARFLIEAPLDEPDPASRIGRSVIARRIVVRQLLNKHGVTIIKENGHYVVTLTDETALRDGIAKLLADAQRMVSLNEEKSGAQLLAAHGGALPLTWREDVTTRFESRRVPVSWTFLYPELEVTRSKDSSVKDITLKRGMEEP